MYFAIFHNFESIRISNSQNIGTDFMNTLY